MASVRAISLAVIWAVAGCAAQAQNDVVVATPARAGAVEGTSENSDAFIWRIFTGFVAPVSDNKPSPVVFETWASDKDTFSTNPHWPEPGEPMKLQPSVLQLVKMLDPTVSHMRVRTAAIDEPCKPPIGAAIGEFPTSGTPTPCIAEQVARNRPQFDYIVKNKLNTQAGLAAAYANSFQVDLPKESIAIKGDWIPLASLLQWVPALGDLNNVRKLYYTVTVNKVEYALVAMHVSSRQNPSWVWGTFEHQMNPGRCDYIGCFDSFGAQVTEVFPNRVVANTQYGACLKTKPLKDLMAKARLSPVWENYCLKSTQVDYSAPDGTPYVLGNSVVEGIVGNGTVAASSCISCHAYASFGANGRPTEAAKRVLPFNPTGKPIQNVLSGARQFHFMWGVLQAP